MLQEKSNNEVSLNDIIDQTWELLKEGANRAKSDFHLAYFSSIANDLPRTRTVVLRRVLDDEYSIIFHYR
jgi:hypothetical protein